jgi:polyhydroxybutyrate depolymerase
MAGRVEGISAPICRTAIDVVRRAAGVMRQRRLCAAGLAGAALLGVLPVASAAAATAAPDFAAAALRDTAHEQVFAGQARSWRELRPDGFAAPRAIVLLLHGNGGSAARLLGDDASRAAPYRRWRAIAARERLWLVVPDGVPAANGNRGWNDCRADAATNPPTDDTAFLLALVERLQLAAGRARPPAFVVGTSNGGSMALRLAIERPDAFRAYVAIAAAMPGRSECAAPSRPASVLFVNGTADPILPFGGGAVQLGPVFRGSALGAAESVRIWGALNGARGEPRVDVLPDVDGDGNTIERTAFAGRGRGRHDAVLYAVRGGGHNEPSLTERLPLRAAQNGDVEAAQEAWRFCAARLPD